MPICGKGYILLKGLKFSCLYGGFLCSEVYGNTEKSLICDWSDYNCLTMKED